MATVSVGNKVIYYQCKRCSSFVSSTKKWDRHLAKCLLKQQFNTGNNTQNPQPVGFRLVTFTEPSVVISRVKVAVLADNTKPQEYAPSSMESEHFLGVQKPELEILQRNLGIADTDDDAKQETSDLDNPRHRKSFLKAKATLEQSCKAIMEDEITTDISSESNIAKTRLPKNISKCKKAEENTKLQNRTSKIPNTSNSKVATFKVSCHLCPGKFMKQKELDIHVNQVHHGNRRLMSCPVCERIFNKRDSLNAHIVRHEGAEAREVKFKLFEPWSDELIANEKIKHKAHQQICKACLIKHSSHHSYLEHFRQEHADPPESYSVNCKFKKCSMKFFSIRDLISHAKVLHPKEFHGSLTWLRMTKGIYKGKLDCARDELPVNTRANKHHEKRNEAVKKTRTTKNTPNGKNRVYSFNPKDGATLTETDPAPSSTIEIQQSTDVKLKTEVSRIKTEMIDLNISDDLGIDIIVKTDFVKSEVSENF